MRPASCTLSLVAVLLAAALLPAEIQANASTRLLKIRKAVALQGSGTATGEALTKRFVEVAPGMRVAVRGARERRQVRSARWIEGLAGDRRSVFTARGMPASRHREHFTGQVTEHWTYPGVHRTYVFEGDRLVRVSRF